MEPLPRHLTGCIFLSSDVSNDSNLVLCAPTQQMVRTKTQQQRQVYWSFTAEWMRRPCPFLINTCRKSAQHFNRPLFLFLLLLLFSFRKETKPNTTFSRDDNKFIFSLFSNPSLPFLLCCCYLFIRRRSTLWADAIFCHHRNGSLSFPPSLSRGKKKTYKRIRVLLRAADAQLPFCVCVYVCVCGWIRFVGIGGSFVIVVTHTHTHNSPCLFHVRALWPIAFWQQGASKRERGGAVSNNNKKNSRVVSSEYLSLFIKKKNLWKDS